MSLTLAILLIALGAWALWREKTWRARVSEVTSAAGLRDFQADTLATRFISLQDSNQSLLKEEYLRRLFEALLSEIRQGVAIVDNQMRIKFVNRTLAHLFQKNDIQRGRTLLEEIQDHQIIDVVQSALKDQRRIVREVEFTTLSGNSMVSRHYLIEASPLPAKAESGAWLMVHDITEQHMAEQIRKDFVANASHELRTPLTLINGYVETLQSGVLKDALSIKRCYEVMEKHGKRILRIIEDMLTISRLENANSTLNVEPFSARTCAQDAIDHLSSMLQGRDTRIHLDFPADGGSMRGDRFYWDQVFTNLIENSLKENSNPGLVITITGKWYADHILLSISDNGIGIAAHDLPFVFKRFYRGHKHHSPHIKGTGLGLSIVRRAVEAHGGTIDLTSTPGVETTFTMRVPLQ